MLDQAILSNSHILYKHDQIIFAIDQLAIKLNGKFSVETNKQFCLK